MLFSIGVNEMPLATRARGVPVGEAAAKLLMSRERTIRAVQRGDLVGTFVDGHWFVESDSLEKAIAAQAKPTKRSA